MGRIITRHMYEIVDGKPHLAEYFGKCVTIYPLSFIDVNEDPCVQEAIKVCKGFVEYIKRKNPDLKLIQEEVIVRPPTFKSDPLNQITTVGIKFGFWGRAYKIRRLSIGRQRKRYAKKRVNGRYKWVWVNKRDCERLGLLR